LKDEILITVIATGFDKVPSIRKSDKSAVADKAPSATSGEKASASQFGADELEIPTFLRRNRFNKHFSTIKHRSISKRIYSCVFCHKIFLFYASVYKININLSV